MEREYLKAIIGYFHNVDNEELLERIIKNYEDASYKKAYLVIQNDFKGESTGKSYAVLDYETSFTIIDEYGNAETYYKDNFSERYVDVCEIAYYFKDCYYDPSAYKLFIPLWVDICSTINRYGLKKEKFLSNFKKNNGDINYDAVQEFYYCLKTDSVSSFVKYHYIYKLCFSKPDSVSVRNFIKDHEL